jgi:hypothetical protein
MCSEVDLFKITNIMAKKKKKKLSALAKLKKVLEWYENFAEYIRDDDADLHDRACEYADNTEKE